MWDWVFDIDVDDEALLITFAVISAVVFLYLFFKRFTLRWLLEAFITVFVGGMVGFGVLWLAVLAGAFDEPVVEEAWVWVPLGAAGIVLAVSNLWGSRWWRKVIAVLAIPLFAVTAGLWINAVHGLHPTVGSLVGVRTAQPVELPALVPSETVTPPEPLYQRWAAADLPADLPEHGEQGTVPTDIPNTASGFPARTSGIYLPPAALVANPPRLPFVLFMTDGSAEPDPWAVARVLDEFAASHDGLAPIVLVVDRFGSGDPSGASGSDPLDPLCIDGERGNAETYVMQDVVPWVRANLNVQPEPRFWTVAGFGDGGTCAAYYGAGHPDVFGNLLAISPEEFQGADDPREVLLDVFVGNQANYDAIKPANVMAAHAPYVDSVAIFTVGSLDGATAPGVENLVAFATAAGMKTALLEIAGADHAGRALMGGLREGFALLYPRLELAAPVVEAPEAPVTDVPVETPAG